MIGVQLLFQKFEPAFVQRAVGIESSPFVDKNTQWD